MSTELPGAAENVSDAILAARRHALEERIDGRREDARPRLGSPRPGKPRERRHALRRRPTYSATRGRRAGNPRPGKARTSISGAMKSSAFWSVCCRCPSRATWTRTAGPSTGTAQAARKVSDDEAHQIRPARWTSVRLSPFCRARRGRGWRVVFMIVMVDNAMRSKRRSSPAPRPLRRCGQPWSGAACRCEIPSSRRNTAVS